MYKNIRGGSSGNLRLFHDIIARHYLTRNKEAFNLLKTIENELKKISYQDFLENTSSYTQNALLEIINAISFRRASRANKLERLPESKHLLVHEAQKARKIIEKARY